MMQTNELLPVFPYWKLTKTGKVKYSAKLRTLPTLSSRRGSKYEKEEIIKHVKLLPKGSNERACTINAMVKSGNAKMKRTKIYELYAAAPSSVNDL